MFAQQSLQAKLSQRRYDDVW